MMSQKFNFRKKNDTPYSGRLLPSRLETTDERRLESPKTFSITTVPTGEKIFHADTDIRPQRAPCWKPQRNGNIPKQVFSFPYYSIERLEYMRYVSLTEFQISGWPIPYGTFHDGLFINLFAINSILWSFYLFSRICNFRRIEKEIHKDWLQRIGDGDRMKLQARSDEMRSACWINLDLVIENDWCRNPNEDTWHRMRKGSKSNLLKVLCIIDLEPLIFGMMWKTERKVFFGREIWKAYTRKILEFWKYFWRYNCVDKGSRQSCFFHSSNARQSGDKIKSNIFFWCVRSTQRSPTYLSCACSISILGMKDFEIKSPLCHRVDIALPCGSFM